jgi:hypothetical protein
MSKRTLFLIVALLAGLALLLGSGRSLAQGPDTSQPQASVGRGFTYQGLLKDGSGNPVTNTCDLSFSLWDALSAGTQVGGSCNVTGVQVANGYFAAQVNAGGEFSGNAFTGDARWLEIAVQCTGDPGFTTLSPRQELTAAPYAMSLRPGALIEGAGGVAVIDTRTGGSALFPNVGVGAWSRDTTGIGYGVVGGSWSSTGGGVYGRATSTTGEASGVYGSSVSADGYGVYGYNGNSTGASVGVYGGSGSTDGTGVYGVASTSNGTTYGVYGESYSDDSSGVYGLGHGRGTGVHAAGYIGLIAEGESGVEAHGFTRGVLGTATCASCLTWGVWGKIASTAGYGVYGEADATSGVIYGVFGNAPLSPDGIGVGGSGYTAVLGDGNNIGVQGKTDYGWLAVYGQNQASTVDGHYHIGVAGETYGTDVNNRYHVAVQGYATNPGGGIGVRGLTAGNGIAVLGESTIGWAGYFVGNVQVTGTLYKGGGGFLIDHPLDPAHQYLYHSFVESPDMKDVYDGVVMLDAAGTAWVQLPDWFQALNQDFRYQLTPVGAPAPDLYVAQEIQGNRFQVAGGPAGLKVSWQVTGIRHDPYADAYRIPVEQVKPDAAQGTYLHPELYGQPTSQPQTYPLPQGVSPVPQPARAAAAAQKPE